MFDRDDAGSVRPIFKDLAVRIQQLIEPVRLVIAEPAPEYQVGAAGNHMNRVDLNATELAHQSEQISLAWIGWLAIKRLGRNGDALGVGTC